MRVVEHRVTCQEAGRTVKSVALGVLRVSRSQFSSLKYRDGILVNGCPAHADVRLNPGDVLSIRFQDEARGTSPCALPDLPLSVPYTDADYWIIDKPAPLPTLSSVHQTGPTLESAFCAFLGCPADYVFRPVNRLDKGTSGLMAAARNAHAQQLLQRQLHTDLFLREYLAVCAGRPEADQGTIDLPIARSGEGIRREVRSDGARAVTHYRVMDAKNGRSLLRLRLDTGRTHQIRVHLSAMGCPIMGDYLYGAPHAALPGRFALHACEIRFRQPLTGETVHVESPLPEELRRVWEEG